MRLRSAVASLVRLRRFDRGVRIGHMFGFGEDGRLLTGESWTRAEGEPEPVQHEQQGHERIGGGRRKVFDRRRTRNQLVMHHELARLRGVQMERDLSGQQEQNKQEHGESAPRGAGHEEQRIKERKETGGGVGGSPANQQRGAECLFGAER